MKILQEASGLQSSTRVIFVVGSFWNMIMTSALAFASTGVKVGELIAFYTAIQAVLVGLKLGQKPMEKKI
jgi:hypothetical protein